MNDIFVRAYRDGVRIKAEFKRDYYSTIGDRYFTLDEKNVRIKMENLRRRGESISDEITALEQIEQLKKEIVK